MTYAGTAPKKIWKGSGHHYMLTTFDHSEEVLNHGIYLLAGNQNYAGKVTYEQCPSTKRAHIHLYLYTRNSKTRQAAKKWLSDLSGSSTPNVIQLNTLAHAQNGYGYVGKAYTSTHPVVEFGDNNIIPDYVKDKGAEEEEVKLVPGENWNREVYIFEGKPFTGKSTAMNTLCETKFPGAPIFRIAPPGKGQKGSWVGGYTGEPCVIIDEFNPHHFAHAELKMLLDRLPQTIVTGAGGKSVYWAPQLILCSFNGDSNVKPLWSFEDCERWIAGIGDYSPFLTRITKVIRLTHVFPTTGRECTFDKVDVPFDPKTL